MARIYGVEIRRLNEQVKRNADSTVSTLLMPSHEKPKRKIGFEARKPKARYGKKGKKK